MPNRPPVAASGAAPVEDDARAADTQPAEPELPSILMIGDSMMFGGFGKTLDRLVRTISRGSDQVWTRTSCGTSPLAWLEGIPTKCGAWDHEPGRDAVFKIGDRATPKFSTLLDTYHPDVTVVALGMNLVYADNKFSPPIRRMIEQIERAGSRCIWIGPPKTSTYPDSVMRRINRLIASEATGHCHMIWSTELTNYPKVRGYMDGTHYDPIEASKWAERVFEIIRPMILNPELPKVETP